MSSTTTTRTMRYYREKERVVFQKIPGMAALIESRFSPDAVGQYPDAAFACMVADNLLCGDREQSAINQRAYFAILNGEPIANVRFRYDKETGAYLNRHMWDD